MRMRETLSLHRSVRAREKCTISRLQIRLIDRRFHALSLSTRVLLLGHIADILLRVHGEISKQLPVVRQRRPCPVWQRSSFTFHKRFPHFSLKLSIPLYARVNNFETTFVQDGDAVAGDASWKIGHRHTVHTDNINYAVCRELCSRGAWMLVIR